MELSQTGWGGKGPQGPSHSHPLPWVGSHCLILEGFLFHLKQLLLTPHFGSLLCPCLFPALFSLAASRLRACAWILALRGIFCYLPVFNSPPRLLARSQPFAGAAALGFEAECGGLVQGEQESSSFPGKPVRGPSCPCPAGLWAGIPLPKPGVCPKARGVSQSRAYPEGQPWDAAQQPRMGRAGMELGGGRG